MTVRKYTYYVGSIARLIGWVKPLPQVLKTFLRLSPPGARQQIELRGSGARFYTRGAMDIWSVKETFLDRFYERFGMRLQPGWTVVDIGGGIGEFTIFAALAHPDNKVYAYEPTPDSFALLQENLRLNRVNNVQAFAEAIWSENGTLTLDMTVGEPSQFISYAGAEPQVQNGKVVVPSISLTEAFARLGITRCDLLKLDCEGAEFAILFNTPDETLSRIERIVMEYHDSPTEYTHRDLAKFLQSKGFQVETFTNWVHPDLGYLRAWRSQQ